MAILDPTSKEVERAKLLPRRRRKPGGARKGSGGGPRGPRAEGTLPWLLVPPDPGPKTPRSLTASPVLASKKCPVDPYVNSTFMA